MHNVAQFVLTKPSFYALALTGLTSLVVLVLLLANLSQIVKKGPVKLIMVVSLFGIVVGVHGLLHLGLESVYNYNPIEYAFNN